MLLRNSLRTLGNITPRYNPPHRLAGNGRHEVEIGVIEFPLNPAWTCTQLYY